MKTYTPRLNEDGTVTIWNGTQRQWETTSRPSPELLDTLMTTERQMVTRHLANAAVRCACGDLDGTPCAWAGPVNETMIVLAVPPYQRGSADASHARMPDGSRWGGWPSEFAVRLRVERSCADRMLKADPDWVKID